jgi:SAM-dependent methyltransferase
MASDAARWYERAFDATYLECYEQFEQEPVWQMDCDFIQGQLELKPGDTALDLCCGAGRHCLEFARRGLQVTGLDISSSMIDVARARAASLEKSSAERLTWECRDAVALDHEKKFDAVYNYLTSFGHCDDEGNRAILRNVHRALRPGGKLLLEMINMVWLLGNFVPTERRVYPNFTYVERRRYDPISGRITTHRERVVAGENPQVLEPFTVRAYLPCDLRSMLEQTGFDNLSLVASPTGQSFQTFSTPRLAFVARRPL